MYIKVPISEHPPIGQFVIVFNKDDNMFIAQFNDRGEFDYRDTSVWIKPNNNIQLTHWLKKIDEHEQLGKRIDQLENYLFAMDIPLPAAMHVDQLKIGLSEVVPSLKECYMDLFGENPWH